MPADLHPAPAAAEPEVSAMTIRVECRPDRLAFLSEDVRDPIVAFHAEILGNPAWNWRRVREAIGYDNSTMSKAFRGIYTGSYENIATAIASFYDRQAQVAAPDELVHTPIVKTIWSAMDYARANHTGTLVIGPSRTGKTATALAYAAQRDKRRLPVCVYIAAWPSGGVASVRSALCRRLGIPTRLNPAIADEKIIAGIGRSRLLIVDEAHRLLGSKSGSKCLDYVRAITDEVKCGFAILATARFEEALLESAYMFEQLIGRIEAPIRVGEQIGPGDWQPIVAQFFADGLQALREDTLQALARVAASSGHFASIVHVMHLAQRDASLQQKPLCDAHVRKAIEWRRQKFNQKFFIQRKGGLK